MRVLGWGVAFGAAGALCAALAVRGSAGEGWDALPGAAGLAAFLLATLLRRLVDRRTRRGRWRGAGLGALVALLSHPLAWFLAGVQRAVFGGPSSPGEPALGAVDAASASLVLSLWSLLLTGWWTVPGGAALGFLLTRLERKRPAPEGEAPAAETRVFSPPRVNPMVLVSILFCVGIVLLMVGGFVYAPLYDLPAGFDWTTVIGVALAMLAVLGYLLRERRNPLVLLALACFFVVPTALALAIGARLTLNGLLDRAEATHHTARVLSARRVESGTGPTRPFRMLEVESWRAGDPPPWIVVHPRLYEEATPGRSEVGVVTKPGWLGIEWVVQAHLELPEGAAEPAPGD